MHLIYQANKIWFNWLQMQTEEFMMLGILVGVSNNVYILLFTYI